MFLSFGTNWRVQGPPWSPDFNQPAEHVFNVVKPEYMQRTDSLPAHDMMPAAKQLLTRVIQERVTTESVRRGVDRLPLFWDVVASTPDQLITAPNGRVYSGVHGDWLPHELR